MYVLTCTTPHTSNSSRTSINWGPACSASSCSACTPSSSRCAATCSSRARSSVTVSCCSGAGLCACMKGGRLQGCVHACVHRCAVYVRYSGWVVICGTCGDGARGVRYHWEGIVHADGDDWQARSCDGWACNPQSPRNCWHTWGTCNCRLMKRFSPACSYLRCSTTKQDKSMFQEAWGSRALQNGYKSMQEYAKNDDVLCAQKILLLYNENTTWVQGKHEVWAMSHTTPCLFQLNTHQP